MESKNQNKKESKNYVGEYFIFNNIVRLCTKIFVGENGTIVIQFDTGVQMSLKDCERVTIIHS